MSDTEDQLRSILREHAADSGHLLDDLLTEEAEEQARIERSLSALREAVGRVLVAFENLGPGLKAPPGWDAFVEALGALESAHDAAPVPQAECRCGGAAAEHGPAHNPWCSHCSSCSRYDPEPAPPMLTMEEVKEALEELIEDEGSLPFADGSWWTWVEGALNRVLAQKGADRGG